MKVMKALRVVVLGPFLLAGLVLLNVAASPGQWWVQWPALAIAFMWARSLVQVLRAIVFAGGMAAFTSFVLSQRR
jgi:hypothetical protein